MLKPNLVVFQILSGPRMGYSGKKWVPWHWRYPSKDWLAPGMLERKLSHLSRLDWISPRNNSVVSFRLANYNRRRDDEAAAPTVVHDEDEHGDGWHLFSSILFALSIFRYLIALCELFQSLRNKPEKGILLPLFTQWGNWGRANFKSLPSVPQLARKHRGRYFGTAPCDTLLTKTSGDQFNGGNCRMFFRYWDSCRKDSASRHVKTQDTLATPA